MLQGSSRKARRWQLWRGIASVRARASTSRSRSTSRRSTASRPRRTGSTRASRPNPGPRSDDRGDLMAKKKKRPRHPASERPRAPRGGANLERRDRKEEARRLREAERRRARRAASLRRTLTSAGIAVAAVAAISLFRTFQGPDDIPEAAVLAASEAGC